MQAGGADRGRGGRWGLEVVVWVEVGGGVWRCMWGGAGVVGREVGARRREVGGGRGEVGGGGKGEGEEVGRWGAGLTLQPVCVTDR